MNRTPKMPPRSSDPYYCGDDHYRPDRLLRAAAEIIAVAIIVLAVIWGIRS